MRSSEGLQTETAGAEETPVREMLLCQWARMDLEAGSVEGRDTSDASEVDGEVLVIGQRIIERRPALPFTDFRMTHPPARRAGHPSAFLGAWPTQPLSVPSVCMLLIHMLCSSMGFKAIPCT